LFGGVLGLGSNLILSDERAKTDIKKIGQLDDGQNIYKYHYLGENQPMQVGLMAQEVEEKKPEAVVEINGLKLVNYEKAL